MAEAAVEMSAARFFCHRCVQEVNPLLPDYVCPRCQLGFIEELDQPSVEAGEESGADTQSLSRIPDRGGFETAAQADQQGTGLSIPRPFRRTYRFGRSTNRHQGQENEPSRNQRAEMFLQQLFINLLTENTGFTPAPNFPVFLNLHSNPRDYVWGRGGWNAIISQLINQLDGTGPPPLPKEKIDEIPFIPITQEQVDKVLQCTVCMEDFNLEEPVRKLSCEHHFHNECIIPWLELHGTCPICRKILIDESSQECSFASQANSMNTFSQDPGPSSIRTEPQRSSNSASTSNFRPRSPPHYPSVFDFTDEYD